MQIFVVYSIVPYSIVPYSIVLYSIVLHCTVQWSAEVYIGDNIETKKIYAGMTKREVRKRMMEHVRAIRNKDESHPIGLHFKENNHGVDKFRMVPIMQVRGNPFVLRSLEKKIIARYKLVQYGLNRQR